jgi:hypothetical protein
MQGVALVDVLSGDESVLILVGALIAGNRLATLIFGTGKK